MSTTFVVSCARWQTNVLYSENEALYEEPAAEKQESPGSEQETIRALLYHSQPGSRSSRHSTGNLQRATETTPTPGPPDDGSLAQLVRRAAQRRNGDEATEGAKDRTGTHEPC